MKSKSIRQLRLAISRLKPDRPISGGGVWYRTQHEHWIGWLGQYHTSGAYGRDASRVRDAKFAYNHIVNSQMLIWLARAAGVSSRRLRLARNSAMKARSLAQEAAMVRTHIPWELIEQKLWPSKGSTT